MDLKLSDMRVAGEFIEAVYYFKDGEPGVWLSTPAGSTARIFTAGQRAVGPADDRSFAVYGDDADVSLRWAEEKVRFPGGTWLKMGGLYVDPDKVVRIQRRYDGQLADVSLANGSVLSLGRLPGEDPTPFAKAWEQYRNNREQQEIYGSD